MKVVFLDYNEEIIQDFSSEEALFQENGIELVRASCPTEDEMIKQGQNADGILYIGYVGISKLTRRVIEQLKKCRVIVRYGIGYDGVDVDAATDMGIAVCNVTDYCTEEVATHAIALMLDGLRSVTLLSNKVKQGNWDNIPQIETHTLSSLTVGLAGFGSIPRQVARLLQGFSCNLISYDPFVPDDVFKEHGVEPVPLDELCRRSDILSVHVPLNEDTYHLFDKEKFDLMKNGVIVINTSRAPVISEADMVKALEAGKIKAAGLDVIESDPQKNPDARILNFDNVTLTPHTAFYSEQSSTLLKKLFCESAIQVLKGNLPNNVINRDKLKRPNVKNL